MNDYELVQGKDDPNFKMFREFEIANKQHGQVIIYRTNAFGDVVEWDNEASTGKLINTDKINGR